MTLLADIVAASAAVAADSSRRAKAAAIAQCLRALAPDEVAIAVSYLAGELPQGRTGIGWAAIRAARPTGAMAAPALTVREVDAEISAIAAIGGPGSTAHRQRRLGALFAKATAAEQDFLARLLIGELRQGALEGLMIEGVAAAADLPVAHVRRAAMVAGGIARVAGAALAEGGAGLARFAMRLFHPVAPMLAQPADDIDSALATLPGSTIEWKMDGARVQAHKSGADVRLYTRSLHDVTAAAPEVVDIVRTAPVHELILDGEVIALHADGRPYTFQVTMSRFSRTLDIDAQRAALPLCVFFFDCLRLEANDLVGEPTPVRAAALGQAMPPAHRMPSVAEVAPERARAFYADAIARGHEGVMVKAHDAIYEPGTRSAGWLKVKREHTLDLVVLAAEWGHGRRHGWLSNLHLGARDPGTGTFVMLGKTFKGMTDAILAWQTQELLAREIGREGHVVHVRPELVVEVTFNDLQASPRYPAGLALRFARIKGYRTDKRADEADTLDTVRAIYSEQSARMAG